MKIETKKQNKNNKTNQAENLNQTKPKVLNETLSPFCFGQLLVGMEPILVCSLNTRWTPLEKSDFYFLPQQKSIVNSFCVRDGTLCPFPPLWAVVLSILSVCSRLTLPVSVRSYVPVPIVSEGTASWSCPLPDFLAFLACIPQRPWPVPS